MKTRMLLLIMVVVAITAALNTPALAKKPDNSGKPAPEPTAAPSCEERVNVYGATAWNLGAYQPDTDSYSAIGLPACIDITEPEHLYVDPAAEDPELTQMQWSVTLSGEATRFRGLKLVFEQGVHGTMFEDADGQPTAHVISADTAWIDPETGHYVFDDTPVWTTDEFAPSGEPVSFVAMPRSGDKWVTTPVVTLHPVPAG